jgi:hypothetical protein
MSHPHVHLCALVCMCLWAYLCLHVYMRACVSVCMLGCVCVWCVCVCACLCPGSDTPRGRAKEASCPIRVKGGQETRRDYSDRTMCQPSLQDLGHPHPEVQGSCSRRSYPSGTCVTLTQESGSRTHRQAWSAPPSPTGQTPQGRACPGGLGVESPHCTPRC